MILADGATGKVEVDASIMCCGATHFFHGGFMFWLDDGNLGLHGLVGLRHDGREFELPRGRRVRNRVLYSRTLTTRCLLPLSAARYNVLEALCCGVQIRLPFTGTEAIARR